MTRTVIAAVLLLPGFCSLSQATSLETCAGSAELTFLRTMDEIEKDQLPPPPSRQDCWAIAAAELQSLQNVRPELAAFDQVQSESSDEEDGSDPVMVSGGYSI